MDVLSVLAADDVGDQARAADASTGTLAPDDTDVEPDGSPGEVPDQDELAVPDYDALAASQVVPRLATLSPEELEAIGRYERAHRNRQTILNKVSQLRGG